MKTEETYLEFLERSLLNLECDIDLIIKEVRELRDTVKQLTSTGRVV